MAAEKKSEFDPVLDASVEFLVNNIRFLSIIVFFCIHLINFYGISLGPLVIEKRPDVDADFFQKVSIAILIWIFTGVLIRFLIQRSIYWPPLKYYTTAVDIILTTFFLYIGNGLASPLASLYFLIIGTVSLRGHLDLMRFTLAAISFSSLFVLWDTMMEKSHLGLSFGTAATFLSTLGVFGAIEYFRLTKLESLHGDAK